MCQHPAYQVNVSRKGFCVHRILANFLGHCIQGRVYVKSLIYENNDSCKERLVTILTLHTECNFNFRKAFFFTTTPSPVHYQPSRDSKLL